MGTYMRYLLKLFNKLDVGMELIEKKISTVMFFGMFLVFVVSIVFRYFFKAILWGYELSLLFFLWIAVLGSCYANRTDENIKFDSLYNGGSERRRQIFDIIGSLLVISTFAASLLPSIDYIVFLNFEKSDSLPLRKSVIFSVYTYFLVGMIFQYSRKLFVSITNLTAVEGKRASK